MAEEERRDPESFLGLEAESPKGKLKLYLGGAAGVGKTYRMLEEAHQLRAEGRDVVLGLIEPHQRKETAALIHDLEMIPLREISYRGATLKEMDLDGILARKPEYVVVDELAHTNVPGSRNRKRYQDVEQLLTAGINVITALNVQHLESIAPVVKRITGVEIRETVPDAFLTRADQLIDVDISVEALRQRLREGKIYQAEQIENAFKNFFKPANLAALRELALREVARDQRRKREERELVKREGGRHPHPALEERIMVCLSTRPGNSQQLLRKACRAAGELNIDWYAVHVETPSGIRAEDQHGRFPHPPRFDQPGRRPRSRGGVAEGFRRSPGDPGLRPRQTHHPDYGRTHASWPVQPSVRSFYDAALD